jgi:hypothetical protein
VIDAAAAARDRAAAVAAYEALRDHVLTGSAVAGPVGVVLVLREGIDAWMAHRAGDAVAALRVDRDQRAPAPIVADDRHAGVVRVLACMALAVRGARRA